MSIYNEVRDEYDRKCAEEMEIILKREMQRRYIDPLILRGEEWRHRLDPSAGLKDGGPWVRKVVHNEYNTQHYGAMSPGVITREDAALFLHYLGQLECLFNRVGMTGKYQL